MNTLIQTIKTKILNNKKNILFVVFFMLLLSVDNTFAADETQKKTTEIFNTIIALWNTVFAIWRVLIWILTQFVWLFLQPAWTTGSVIWLDWHLKSLWVLVSNLVYFVFAFLLIVVAFMNIIWKWDNSWQMKTALPHFIVWIIIVPFSWFIIQFVLSISALLTVSSLSLPWDMFRKWDWNAFSAITIPKSCTVNVDKMMEWATATWSAAEARAAAWFDCSKDPKNQQKLTDMMSNWQSLFSIMYVYSYWVMRVQDFDKLFVNQTNIVSWIWTLAVNVLFNAIFILRFLILLIALAIAMFSRWVVLWLFTIFSPIFWLLYFFNWKVPAWLKSLEKLSFKNFIWLAMVPVYVWLALSFWLLFAFIATQWLSNNWIKWDDWNFIQWDKMNIWGMELTITWRMLWAHKVWIEQDKAEWLTTWWAGFIWQLFIDLIAIAVLWMAVIAALKSSEITWSVIAPIEQFGKSIGQTAMKLPQYAPVFPGWQTMDWLRRTWSSAKTYFDTKSQNSWDDFMKRNNLFQSDSTKAANTSKTATNTINNQAWWQDSYKKYIDALKEFKDVNTITNSPEAKDLLKTVAEKNKIDITKMNLGKTEDIATLVGQIHNNNLNLWNWINWTSTKIDKLTVDDLNDNLKWSRNNPSDDNSWATSKNNWWNTWNTAINLNINNISNIWKELTDSNWLVKDWKELARYLIKVDGFKDNKLSEEQVRKMFNWWQENELIEELKIQWYFNKSE
jgi:hypothetical protein